MYDENEGNGVGSARIVMQCGSIGSLRLRVCLVLLLKLLLLFEKSKANQTHWLSKAAFPLVQN